MYVSVCALASDSPSSARVLKHYAHTLNHMNVVTLSLRCKAFAAHQSASAEEGFGFEIFRLLLIYLGLCSEAQGIDLTLESLSFPPLSSSAKLKSV